jgi:hypothetical protein
MRRVKTVGIEHTGRVGHEIGTAVAAAPGS